MQGFRGLLWGFAARTRVIFFWAFKRVLSWVSHVSDLCFTIYGSHCWCCTPTWRVRGLRKWVSNPVTLIVHIAKLVMPIINPFTKSPDPPNKVFT